MIRQFATLGPVGYLPKAPGTYASALAAIAACLLHLFGTGFWTFLILVILATMSGTLAVDRILDDPADDPSEVVIDELAGQWVALLPVSWLLSRDLVSTAGALPLALLSFLLFRILDILKPPPIRWAERMHGAIGIMADDLLAGIGAALALFILVYMLA